MSPARTDRPRQQSRGTIERGDVLALVPQTPGGEDLVTDDAAFVHWFGRAAVAHDGWRGVQPV